MERWVWGLLSVGVAVVALWVAATSSTLRAYGLNPEPGVRAVVVRVDNVSSTGLVAVVSTVGTQAQLIADFDQKNSGGAARDVTLRPVQLWQSWRPADWLQPSPQVCTYTLQLGSDLKEHAAMFDEGSLLWVKIPPARINSCDNDASSAAVSGNTPIPVTVADVGPVAVFSGNLPRVLILLLTFAWLLFLIQAMVPGGRFTGLKRLLVGKDNRYSNAQFQMFAWFLVFIGGYVSTLVWRIASGNLQLAVGIASPTTLLALTGLAAGTYGLATVITAANADSGQSVKPPADAPRVENLYTDDAGRFDFGDFQSLVVTLVAVVGYLIALAGWQETVFLGSETTLPDVGATILTIFGAGQATYLLKKGLRTDAVHDLGVTLQPDTVTLDAGRVHPGALLLDVWHAAAVTVTDLAVSRQPAVPGGAGTVSVPAVGAGTRITAQRDQYPVTVDTTALARGEYTFELSVGTATLTQTVVGQFRVA
ncbi:hypothetical protein HNQ07_001817 [Deinococcus metalli]|uniref:Uncharacterized protein n=1 Tax=Deinococcus metalli TaxID=1141878 RepID=A0A7W8KDU1_9DEIO|nr:hypothetical protein [Deinococcus metalli]MBB5376360.1 hypothetical protein [Deinococcus metalli]GHF38874.1 hypothetical protein GCM10017781_14210 [Deinococcus metalli]